jgi:hypothetical protein
MLLNFDFKEEIEELSAHSFWGSIRFSDIGAF